MGVDMGAPYHGDYYEPQDLATSLRRWWSETETGCCRNKFQQSLLAATVVGWAYRWRLGRRKTPLVTKDASDGTRQIIAAEEAAASIQRVTHKLDDRELQIVRALFGFGRNASP